MPHFHHVYDNYNVAWHPAVIFERYGEHGWHGTFVLCHGRNDREFCTMSMRSLRDVWS